MSDALSCYSTKPTSPKDSNTVSKEQRPPFKGIRIFTNADVYFIKHFKNISNVTVFIFLTLSGNINLARNTQEFLEMKPPKDQDMRMIPPKKTPRYENNECFHKQLQLLRDSIAMMTLWFGSKKIFLDLSTIRPYWPQTRVWTHDQGW